jgi:hypothetical protein
MISFESREYLCFKRSPYVANSWLSLSKTNFTDPVVLFHEAILEKMIPLPAN